MMKTIITQNEKGLYIKDGVIEKELSAGVYRSYDFKNEEIITYSIAPQFLTLRPQITTSDSVSVGIMVTLESRIVNAVTYYSNGGTLYDILSMYIKLAIEKATHGKTLEALLSSDNMPEQSMLDEVFEPFGIAVRILTLDVVLSRNLQNALDAQEVARQRAKAELEEARGRTAVVRHYANTAKLVKDNPDILRLLLGQKAKSVNVAFDATGK